MRIFHSMIFFMLLISFYLLYLHAKRQVINTFTFVENTENPQMIFEDIIFEKVNFSRKKYITFVFKSKLKLSIAMKYDFGSEHLYWDLGGAIYIDELYYSSYIPIELYQRKLKSYKNHTTEPNNK